MRSKLFVMTLALDSLPWIGAIFAELTRLRDVDWKWTVVEGAALNNGSTKWMTRQPARLSSDGTSEFLQAMDHHPRIEVIQAREWDSKDEMVNCAVETFTSPGILLQQDSDELHTCDQYRQIVDLFDDDPQLKLLRFDCDYFLGPNVRSTDAGKPSEWLRAWRFTPGMRFISHEPPNLAGNHGKGLSRTETAALGLRFQHHAWTLPKHVEMKQQLYGKRYAGVSEGWRKLQANKEWPVADVSHFLPKAFAGTPADKIF